MEYVIEDSKEGYFDVYQHQNGKKYIVLEGLDPRQVHEQGKIEQFTRAHYNEFASAYWLLLFMTMMYLLCTYIISPLWYRVQSPHHVSGQ